MDLFTSSVKIIKKYQSDSGAYIASPNLAVYNYSWFRDGSWIAYAMLISGEIDSSEKFHDWCSNVIVNHKKKILRAIKKHKNGVSIGRDFIHARYTIDGKEVRKSWGEFQLDGLGIWLWSLYYFIKNTHKKKENWLKATGFVCDYLKEIWKTPCNDLWEENPKKIHTSTLASIYGGLKCFSNIFPEKRLEETCKEIKEFIFKNNLYKDRLTKFLGSKEIDASLIMCSIPFNVFYSNEFIMKKTISEIVNELRITKGLRRYKNDSFYGGGEWIILACLIGLYYLDIGKIKYAEEILVWIENQKDENNYLPEQINPINKSEFINWKNKWGKPANPLLWSHAMYIILKTSLQNRLIDPKVFKYSVK